MPFPRIHANPAACATILGLALLGSLAPRTGAATTKPDAAHELVLFMGLDLSVKEGKRFYQVEDVDGSEFVISVDGKNKFVRTRMQSNNLKIGRDLKLAPVSVQLDDRRARPVTRPPPIHASNSTGARERPSGPKRPAGSRNTMSRKSPTRCRRSIPPTTAATARGSLRPCGRWSNRTSRARITT